MISLIFSAIFPESSCSTSSHISPSHSSFLFLQICFMLLSNSRYLSSEEFLTFFLSTIRSSSYLIRHTCFSISSFLIRNYILRSTYKRTHPSIHLGRRPPSGVCPPPLPGRTSPNPRHLAVGWLTRARVCSVYVQLCGWQAGWLACSFESSCVRTLQLSFY